LYVFYEYANFSKKSLRGAPGKKVENFFHDKNPFVCRSINAIFHGDYGSDIIFVRKSSKTWHFAATQTNFISKEAVFGDFLFLIAALTLNDVEIVISMKNCINELSNKSVSIIKNFEGMAILDGLIVHLLIAHRSIIS